ncbi:hypothetical protein CPT_Moonbeam155 [Bacillus phage Moonbeam]|uniref:Uncharacterized protein n=1 Tax=Bacillus phage Moonbeam TaxID=1540091 RepID=A0A0A0RV84_9CAUD|nr:hypothetical protein CPT_Moonbeam155 [Bacillus phage Moonbeam]AIW03553.1 hypothetical protein CPT_Moonbeam155 [Bacillus phage Moonbeam]
MQINSFKVHTASLKKVKNLLNDPGKKVQGVFYKNTHFSQRYLARAYTLIKDINVVEGRIKLQVSMRIEGGGLPELENTLEELVAYNAGDVPGFTPEGYFEGSDLEEEPLPVDVVATTKELYNVDILLNMGYVHVTYQEFRIAGKLFTLVNLHNILGSYEEVPFEQMVTLLFGEADNLYFFSNFHNENLSVRDSKLILDLIMDENITGKVIKQVKLESVDGVSASVNPYEELISSYVSMDGDYIFGMGAGHLKIPKDELGNYKMRVIPQGPGGSYQIMLFNNKNTIRLYME